MNNQGKCIHQPRIEEEIAIAKELDDLAAQTKECHCDRMKHRDEKEYKDLYHRLNRIEGQVRGVKRMLDEDCYCVDILNQVSAINAALKAFSCELLNNHIKTCVADDLKQGNEETIAELMGVLKKFMK